MQENTIPPFRHYPQYPEEISEKLGIPVEDAQLIHGICNLADKVIAVIALNEMALTVLRHGSLIISSRQFTALYGPAGIIWERPGR